jgi:hypothetical protein
MQSGLAHNSAFRIRVWKFDYPEENRYMVSRKALELWKQRIPVLLQMENSLDFRERRCPDRSSARVCI